MVVTKKGSIRLLSVSGRIADSVDISSAGYLIIPNASVLETLRSYLVTLTHTQVRDLFTEEGFDSYGESLYALLDEEQVNDEQAANYILDDNRIVEIEELLYKPITTSSCSTRPFDFMLLMDNALLTNSTFESLTAGTYDANSMVQIPMDGENTDLIEETRHLVDSVGYGLQITTAASCATTVSRRPFIGRGGGCCFETSTPGEYWACYTHYYFFLVMVDSNGGCGYTYGCQGYSEGRDCHKDPPE